MPSQVIAYPIRDNLYLNITDRCTLQCEFCPKYNDSHQVHQYDLTIECKPTISQIIQAIGDPTRYNEIVFCGYGEPTLRLKELLTVAKHIKSLGGRVRLNTDGLANRVHKRNVLPELSSCIDAISISMNAHNAEVYNRHCRPALADSFQSMLDFIAQAPEYIRDVTATAIEGLEGVDIQRCAAIAEELGVKFRRRQLDVVG